MFVYYYSILAVLFIGLVCLLIIHRAHRRDESEAGFVNTRQKWSKKHSDDKLLWAKRDHEHRLVREIHSIPTPWGWPQHTAADRGKAVSALPKPVQSFTDGILRRKGRMAGVSAESRSRESMRTLIEDRYVPSNWNSPNEIEYRKVKPPLLRDPNAPHDQMDNFGSRKAVKVRKKLQRVVNMNVEAAAAAKRDELRYVGVKDVKQPWGW